MRTFIVALTLVFLTLTALLHAETEALPQPVIGYRVIHASPQEFHSALTTGVRPHPEKGVLQQTPPSRLTQYFRVKSKLVEGKVVTLDILPEVPLTGTIFEDMASVHVRTEILTQNGDSFSYSFQLNAKFDFEGTLAVDPHPSGAMLTAKFTRDSIEPVLRRLLYRSLYALGFMADRPELAGQ